MKKIKAVLYAEARPNEEQSRRFTEFLEKKYGAEVELEWKESALFPGGFRLEAGGDVYDWSVNGRFNQLKDTLVKLPKKSGSIIPLIREAVEKWSPEAAAEELGKVLTVGDGIATVSGLEHAAYGEIVVFSCGVKGMIQDLRPDRCGVIVFGDCREIEAGSTVKRTCKTAGVPVGEGFLAEWWTRSAIR